MISDDDPQGAKLVHELEQVRNLVAELRREKHTVSARIWDVATKMAVAISMCLIAWVGAMYVDQNRIDTRLQKIEDTKFTREDALNLKSEIVMRESPQLALIVSELRTMTLSFTERLTRLETQVTLSNDRPSTGNGR